MTPLELGAAGSPSSSGSAFRVRVRVRNRVRVKVRVTVRASSAFEGRYRCGCRERTDHIRKLADLETGLAERHCLP